MSGRTFRTGSADRGSVSYMQSTVEGLRAMIRKITVTDDGRLSITLEGEVGDEDTLNQVRNLLLAQRGPVTVDIAGNQGELDV